MLVCCYSLQLHWLLSIHPLLGNYTSESCAMRLLNPSRNLWENKPQRPPVSAQPFTSLAKSQKQVLLQHQRFISLEHW